MLTALTGLNVIAYHGTEGGGDGNPAILIGFLGVVATAAWMLFSTLRWRNTMLVLAAGWLVMIALIAAFVF
jgi:hypothetical protein